MVAPPYCWVPPVEVDALPQYVAVYYPWGAWPVCVSGMLPTMNVGDLPDASGFSVWSSPPEPTGHSEVADVVGPASSPPSPVDAQQQTVGELRTFSPEADGAELRAQVPASKSLQRRLRRMRALKNNKARTEAEIVNVPKAQELASSDCSITASVRENLDVLSIEELVERSKSTTCCVEALELLRTHVMESADSSRALQSFLDVAKYEEVAQVANAFRGHVRQAIQSLHANYVIQKIIAASPAKMGIFIAEELLGQGPSNARHRFGCRVLCRLIEHWMPMDNGGSTGDHLWPVSNLINEVLMDAVLLSRHAYGNFVLQHLLVYGHAEHKHMICRACSEDLRSAASNRNASHVIEKALESCCDEDRMTITSGLAACAELVLQLSDTSSENRYGSYVLRKVLTVRSEHSLVIAHQQIIVAHLRQSASVDQSKFWRKVLEGYQETPPSS